MARFEDHRHDGLAHAAAAGHRAAGTSYHEQIYRIATRQGKLKIREKLIVFGAGGHAKVVIDAIEQQGNYEIAGLLDDDPKHAGKRFFGYPVLGARADLPALLSERLRHAVVTIGDNAIRAEVAALLDRGGWQFASAVHPRAYIGRGVTIGPGSVVMAGCVINAEAHLGAQVIINTGATVDHDCRVEDAVHVAPGCHLCGGVSVGSGTFLGAGTTVTPGVKIGSKAIIGAGSTVIRDVADGAKVTGSPARNVD
jgi:sugar O-acyltransferase (sialic acid O-acetyltransferase NeuD family)